MRSPRDWIRGEVQVCQTSRKRQVSDAKIYSRLHNSNTGKEGRLFAKTAALAVYIGNKH